MKIFLGTKSEQKISIAKEYFDSILDYELIACDVQSDITDQPLDLETTKQGAINRARNIIKNSNFTRASEYLLIGLEGGLVMNDGVYNLVCVAAIINQDNEMFIGVSEYTALPKDVSNRVISGEQFGEAIRDFKSSIIDSHEEKVIQIVEELISRKKSFFEAVEKAYGEIKKPTLL